MLKKLVVTLAQIVEAGIAILVARETILGTFAVASKLKLTFHTLARQRRVLELAELSLLVAIKHLGYRL